MSIFVAEVTFSYEDAIYGELVHHVRAAFRSEAAALSWAADTPARLAQAREEWNPDFGPVPSFDPASDIRLSEMPLFE